MKILFVNKFFYLNGGAETVFFQEREFLLQQGHKVVDFSMADEKNNPSPYAGYFVKGKNFSNGKKIYHKFRQAVSLIHSFEAVKKIEELILREKPQIVHLHNIYHQLTPSIISVLKKHHIKVVLTLHDCKLVCPSSLAMNLQKNKICNECAGRNFWKAFTVNCQDSRVRGFLLAVEAIFHQQKGSYDGVDIFLLPSRFLAELTVRRIPQGKIRLLRNGIDHNIYRPQYEDQGYILYLGRLSTEKGINTLCCGYRNLAANISLKVAGSGPLGKKLRQEFPEIDFLGFQSGEKLNHLIANAAFVVIPSAGYENCPMTALEAMAFGKPLIGSRIGGLSELVEDGRTGFLFTNGNEKELKEKMTLLINQPELRYQMGIAARQKLEDEYSFAEHGRELINIYARLLK